MSKLNDQYSIPGPVPGTGKRLRVANISANNAVHTGTHPALARGNIGVDNEVFPGTYPAQASDRGRAT